MKDIILRPNLISRDTGYFKNDDNYYGSHWIGTGKYSMPLCENKTCYFWKYSIKENTVTMLEFFFFDKFYRITTNRLQ